ncbi:MAG: hypothetical protein GXY83_33650 [Rhodopirellula sp.]|nr:hypothetical protein [Rhodopirellula sp.]
MECEACLIPLGLRGVDEAVVADDGDRGNRGGAEMATLTVGALSLLFSVPIGLPSISSSSPLVSPSRMFGSLNRNGLRPAREAATKPARAHRAQAVGHCGSTSWIVACTV